ncbi:MAG: hypothetical protein HBSIN02_03770 [Bacteroidia bacterium]|nr:MAG: hypothetical protein HBSIN02_03770 [Bacteroidia bacterium]
MAPLKEWRIRALVTVLIFQTPSAILPAQWDLGGEIDRRLQRGIDHIYNLEFYDADKQFDEVIRLRPDHPAGYFFRAMTQWWRILSDFDNESQDERYHEMLERVIGLCEERLKRDPDDITALFFKGGALGFRGRLRVNRGNWFGAIQDGLAALPIVRRAHALDSTNYDVLLGIGIYNYYAEIVPREYPIVRPFMIFLPSGDRAKGLEQLHLAAEKAKYARTEATYFLAQSYFLYEKNYAKAAELVGELSRKYPRNPQFLRYWGRCLVTLSRWEEGFKVFSRVVESFEKKQVGFREIDAREAYYYLGKYFFLRQRYEDAAKNFQECERLSYLVDKNEESGFLSMAVLHRGMIYDVTDRRKDAVAQYRRVLAMKEYEQTHRDARRFLETPYKGSAQ